MRKAIKKAAAVFILIFTAGSWAAAESDIGGPYYFDFEDGAVNGAWSSYAGTSDNQDSSMLNIEDTGEAEHGKAMRLTTPQGKQHWLFMDFQREYFNGRFVMTYAVKPMAARNRVLSVIGRQADERYNYGSAILRLKTDGGFFYDPAGKNSPNIWFSTAKAQEWNYVCLIFDQETHSYSVAHIDSEGGLKFESSAKTDGIFSDRIVNGFHRLEWYTDAAGDAEDCWYDDITLVNYETENMEPVSVNVRDPQSVKPETRSITLKYPACFLKEHYAGAENTRITVRKNGIEQQIKDFTVANTPNSVTIEFTGGLKSNSEYSVSFGEGVETVYGSKPAEYSFKTGAAEGRCAVEETAFYNKNERLNPMYVPENADRIEIIYQNPMNEDGLGAVSIDGAEFVSSYDPAAKKQTLTFLKPLEAFADYELIIPETITDISGNTLERETVAFSAVRGEYEAAYTVKKGEETITAFSQLKAGDEAEIGAELSGAEDRNSEAILYVSVYDKNGLLKGFAAAELSKGCAGSVKITVPENCGGGLMRIMITDRLFRPLAKKHELNGGGGVIE